MNKRVFLVSLVLVVVFLCAMYVGKIFFPKDFVLLVENERLLTIGRFIDSHPLLYRVCTFITAFITYWLFCCAVGKRQKLGWKMCLIIVGTLIVSRLAGLINTNFATHINITAFFVFPIFVNADMKNVALVYGVHGFAQILSLAIRDLPMYFSNEVSFLTMFLMTSEMYLWLILFYLIFNYKKEK